MYEQIDNGTCVCIPGFVRNATGQCVCPPGEILSAGSCICDPSLRFVRNPLTHICECPPHEILINGTCDCALGYSRDPSTGVCKTLNPDTGKPADNCLPKTPPPAPNCTALIIYREGNLTNAIMNLFANIFNVLETNYGNINNIVVHFYQEVLAIMGFSTPALTNMITSYIESLIMSCPYDLAKISSCNISNLVLASDQEIYIASDNFGTLLLSLPCP